MLISSVAAHISGLMCAAVRYAWMPIGSLMFRVSYRRACRNGVVCLNVGAGTVRLDGWLNTDISPRCLYVNVKRRLPIMDNTISYIFGEQFIEYLPRQTALAFIKECFRVLRPNGVLRITNEDLGAFTRAYLNNPEDVRLLNELNRQHGYKYTSYPIDIFNKYFFEDGIVCAYDAQTVQQLFYEAGFQNIINCQYGVSSHIALSGIERHKVNTIQNKFVFAIEGTKRFDLSD